MEKRYRNTNDNVVKESNKVNKINVIMQLVGSLVEALNLIVVLGVGIILYLYKYVDLGSVMSFLILQEGISYMIDILKDFFSSINSQIVNFERTFEILGGEIEEGIFNKSMKRISCGILS